VAACRISDRYRASGRSRRRGGQGGLDQPAFEQAVRDRGQRGALSNLANRQQVLTSERGLWREFQMRDAGKPCT
jgi:hypothetical protein